MGNAEPVNDAPTSTPRETELARENARLRQTVADREQFNRESRVRWERQISLLQASNSQLAEEIKRLRVMFGSVRKWIAKVEPLAREADEIASNEGLGSSDLEPLLDQARAFLEHGVPL